jgi:hypothetical protein
MVSGGQPRRGEMGGDGAWASVNGRRWRRQVAQAGEERVEEWMV